MSDHKAVSRIAGEYGDILKTENCMKRRAKLETLKAYAQTLRGSARVLILKYYPDLFTTTK
jgi:hypothetical protein